MLQLYTTSFDMGLDLQATSYSLVVVARKFPGLASFHIRFDFQSSFPFFEKLRLMAARTAAILVQLANRTGYSYCVNIFQRMEFRLARSR
jgi:hypothetical protein